MKYAIYFLLVVMFSCKTPEYPLAPITKDCKNEIYKLTKDTLNKEWTNETKSSDWKVVYITKFVGNKYEIKTKHKGDIYQGFFISVFLDSGLNIKTVLKEIKD